MSNNFGLDEVTDEVLAKTIEADAKALKEASKETIINRWESGKAITEKQLAYLKGKGLIDPEEIKSFLKTKVIQDKTTGEVIGTKKVTMYVNKMQVRIDNAVGNNIITDVAQVMSNNRRNEENMANLEAKNFDLHHARGELAGKRSVVHEREAQRIADNMAANKIAYLSRKAIYEAAVAAQKLDARDLKEVVAETTPVVTA